MKKRIICVVLTLIMLVSLVPATAITASAATRSISEAAITVLKQMEGYSKYCNEAGYTGYGTLCEKKGEHGVGGHAITEKQANVALREALVDLDAAVNKFASSNGLALSQSKHDALVLFSFENGTAWTTGTGAFKQAVVKGMTSHDFLTAICNFKSDISDDNRRMVEANMYLNGVYSSARPSNFIRVSYDAGEMSVFGEMQQGQLAANAIQYYDASSYPAPHLVPTINGGIFLGWYAANENGDMVLVSNLDSSCHGITLVAGWQYYAANFEDWDEDGKQNLEDLHSAIYVMKSSQLANKNLYSSPYAEKAMTGKNAKGKDKTMVISGSFTIDAEFVDGDNVKWGHILNGEYKLKGESGTTYFTSDEMDCWVKMGAIGTNSNTTVLPEIDVTVTVTNTYVNRRNNASITSTKNGSYNYGAQLRIIDTKNNDGFLWGKVAKSATDNTSEGWIALMYTDFDTAKSQTNVNTSTAIATAVINYNGYVNVRSGAGTDNNIVGALANQAQVDIYEIKYVNGHQWGRCSTGWICLSYAVVNNLTSTKIDYSNDVGYISYVFSGTLSDYTDLDPDTETRVLIYQAPSETAELINIWKMVEPAVTVTNLTNVDGTTWGKIAEGWIRVSDSEGNPIDVVLNTAKFAAVTDTVTVREQPTTGSNRVDTLGMNVEFNVNDYVDGKYVQVVVVGDSVWGYATKVGEDNATYGGWVNLANKYVSRNGVTAGNSGSTSTGSANSINGQGIVSNTYGGVNVRTGAGVAHASLGKIPAGTLINIYETKTVGAADWGRTDKGWVCMDYVTLVGDLPQDVLDSLGGSTGSGSTGSGSTVNSSEAAVFTGTAAEDDVVIYKTTSRSSDPVRTLSAGDPVTIHELLAVTEKVSTGTSNTNEGTTTTTKEVTSNWARVNDGYIYSPGDVLNLDTLDEVLYTMTGSKSLNVRDNPGTDGTTVLFKLAKGDQVIVTRLQIVNGTIWAYVECDGTDEGWACLRYFTRGAVNVDEQENTGNTTAPSTPTTPSEPVGGNTTTNTPATGTATGYLYTGKVIRTNQVNVRAYASTGAAISTTLQSGASLVIYETTISEGMAWGRCDAGWIYLYYVDLTPVTYGVVDAKVVYTEGTAIYSDSNCTEAIGSYSRMTVVDIYEIVGKMARTNAGWVNVDNLG